MPEAWKLRRKPSGQERGRRRGEVFPLRLTAAERAELETLKASTAGPRGLGPWLQWAARKAAIAGVLPTPARSSGARSKHCSPTPPKHERQRSRPDGRRSASEPWA